jgi:hypothetical protein
MVIPGNCRQGMTGFDSKGRNRKYHFRKEAIKWHIEFLISMRDHQHFRLMS